MFLNLGPAIQRALVLVALSGAVCSQTVGPYFPSPFSFIGTIDSMTLNNDPAAGPLAGGTIVVNGFSVTIPKNTLVTLPSITVAWSELFVNNKPDLPLLGTVSWEATVFGNVVTGGERIAGLVYIAQQDTQSLQGFITSIDYNTGHFMVDKVECVLNDPVGRYGKANPAHPLWTVDADNPSVHATTGFPVCIPRSADDPACPLTNRPRNPPNTGAYKTSFTYPAVKDVVTNGLDPRIMAPLVVGDYITYSGIRTAEGVLAVYALEANLGIYTAPGDKPAYITAEKTQFGIIDANPNLETGETRAVAFGTDVSTSIQWYAIDVDPCTGVETERNLILAQPSSIAPVGRVIYRLGKVTATPATREVGFRYTTGTMDLSNGLTAGAFIQPVFDFIFPELITFGNNEIPLEFDTMPFLAQGSGPLALGNYLTTPLATPPIVGALSPWPGSTAPKAISCPPPSTTTPSTTSTSSSSSASSTTTSTPPKETITITSATTRNTKGQTTTSVTATTNILTDQLFMAITGVDNVAPQNMTKGNPGQFSLDISTKGKPSLVNITSSLGGTFATRAL